MSVTVAPDRVKPKQCPICDRWFSVRRSDQRTCSNRCRQKAYRRRKQVWQGDEDGNVFVDGTYVFSTHRELGEQWGRWTETGVEEELPRRLLAMPRRDFSEDVRRLPTRVDLTFRGAAKQLRDLAVGDPEYGRHLAAAARDVSRRAREARRGLPPAAPPSGTPTPRPRSYQAVTMALRAVARDLTTEIGVRLEDTNLAELERDHPALVSLFRLVDELAEKAH